MPEADDDVALLGPADVRRLAAAAGLRPTKRLGQNFVVDANTVRRIVRTAALRSDDVVLEVGPGLGSLTLGLLAGCARVVAVEVDPALAALLPTTVAERAPRLAGRLEVVHADARRLRQVPGPAPSALVANLPYNLAVPILLSLLERIESLRGGLVMVQAEVADRLTAGPGEPAYGVPSVKGAWYADLHRAGRVPRSVFWPVPNVDSGLVAFARRDPPPPGQQARQDTFTVVDAAFAHRRKTLRVALAGWAGSADGAAHLLRQIGVDPGARGEQLSVGQFAALAAARTAGDRAHGPVSG